MHEAGNTFSHVHRNATCFVELRSAESYPPDLQPLLLSTQVLPHLDKHLSAGGTDGGSAEEAARAKGGGSSKPGKSAAAKKAAATGGEEEWNRPFWGVPDTGRV